MRLHKAIVYSFGFNGYDDILTGLRKSILNRSLNRTVFTKNKPSKFVQMYYPKFANDSKVDTVVKNNCKLDKHYIVTGPNASGKTTLLKTVMLNAILSQQIGFGCFDKCRLRTFDQFHCYLNIPDTSGRDSLFQAEARQCKEILEHIDGEENRRQHHLCIFDELYSGTNPKDAVKSASAFMNYLADKKNVSCLLTTHYSELCRKLEKNQRICNCHMNTDKKGGKICYTYKLKSGISTITSGIQVLRDLNYPKRLLSGL
jgi:DNA mismatch repair ATPase MutS